MLGQITNIGPRTKRRCLKAESSTGEHTSDTFEGIGKPEALKHDLSGLWSEELQESIGLYTAITKIPFK